MSTIKDEMRITFLKNRDKYMRNIENKFLCEDAFVKSVYYREHDVLLLYSSIKSEPDTFVLIKKALNDNKKVYLPKVNGVDLIFCLVKRLDELKTGKFGILEPSSDSKHYSGEKALCVVPAMSFDENGHRLGYGKGYYDRFLSSNKNLFKIGFCAGCNFIKELPYEEFDIPVDLIFVDNTIFSI